MELWTVQRTRSLYWLDETRAAEVTGQPDVDVRARGRARAGPAFVPKSVPIDFTVISTGSRPLSAFERANELGRFGSVQAGYPRDKQGRKAFICEAATASM